MHSSHQMHAVTAGPLLTLSGISKSFGTICVADRLDLTLGAGEALGIIGPNGAGKTSLFNLISGALRADAGEIRLGGHDITALPAAARCRAGIGRTHQVPRPFAGMTVFENVLVGATFGKASAGKAAARHAMEALERTGLAAKAEQLAGGLALLDRKRLELARALATQPTLILLDEIAGGLTEHEVLALVDTVRGIHRQGVSILWIEHIVHALLSVVDRLIVVNQGKVLGDGDPATVIASQAVQSIYLGPEAA